MTPKVAQPAARDLLFKFWDDLRNFLTGVARHCFFYIILATAITTQRMVNDPKVDSQVHVTYILIFGTITITFQRV